MSNSMMNICCCLRGCCTLLHMSSQFPADLFLKKSFIKHADKTCETAIVFTRTESALCGIFNTFEHTASVLYGPVNLPHFCCILCNFRAVTDRTGMFWHVAFCFVFFSMWKYSEEIFQVPCGNKKYFQHAACRHFPFLKTMHTVSVCVRVCMVQHNITFIIAQENIYTFVLFGYSYLPVAVVTKFKLTG